MMHLTENELFSQHTNTFYDGVVTFYQSFIQKQLNKFDFKSRLLHTLSCLDPYMSQNPKLPSLIDEVEKTLPISFDKSTVWHVN